MNEINFWNGLTDEEKKIAMEAVADFQAAELKRKRIRINTLKDEVFSNIRTLYSLMDEYEWDDFTEDLKNNLPM